MAYIFILRREGIYIYVHNRERRYSTYVDSMVTNLYMNTIFREGTAYMYTDKVRNICTQYGEKY